MPTGKLAKWKNFLSEFDIVCITRKAIKGQALADHLAENPVEKYYEPLTMYFPNEEVLFIGEDTAELYPWWRMFFDEAADFKGVGINAVLIYESGQHYPTSAKIRFLCTNNIATYEAYILGIRMAVDINIKELLVIGDFDLLIHQPQELCNKFIKIKFRHVLRIQNEFATALATLSSMIQHPNKIYINPIEIEFQDQHTYYFHVDEEADDKPWYYYIKKFLKPSEYLDNATRGQKRALRTLANHFFLNKEFLYRRIPNIGLLRCVDAAEATRLLEERHART
ncbi:uncharacterized protein [Nicotiana tomentosiformis]|uniref:uncharacterized protein n=1 Tax=Nicotiana tomentosiformis TaxID=4098 RepID=UPI00388C4032